MSILDQPTPPPLPVTATRVHFDEYNRPHVLPISKSPLEALVQDGSEVREDIVPVKGLLAWNAKFFTVCSCGNVMEECR